MDDFKILDVLPYGVIIFKVKKIEFISQHILDVLNIAYLNQESSIAVLCKILGLPNETDLFCFFDNHDFFTRSDKVIQIGHTKYNELDLFSFTLIKPSLLSETLQNPIQEEEETQECIENDIDLEQEHRVIDYFKIKKSRQIKVLTFFKGLPLKNFGEIVKINSDSLEIMVDSKHLISLQESNKILLIINENKKSPIISGEVVGQNKNIITIKNFQITKESAHLREGIRIKSNRELLISSDKKDFFVYDISQEGISLYINSQEDEEHLKNQKSLKLKLYGEKLHIDIKYIKTIYENKQILKIIFKIFVRNDISVKINDYMISKQNEIIKELHYYLNEA